jgi:translation elongation factor P/translation initiation factor 5A
MNNLSPIENTYSIKSSYDFLDVLLNNETQQKSLHTSKPIKENDVITKFSAASTLANPSYLTIQTGIDQHITLYPVHLQYINHSCHPTVFFDTTTFNLVALKDISIGEELTFFYPSTELDMAQSFICNCGSNSCLADVKGAKYLSDNEIKKYKLTDFIKNILLNK